MSERPVLFGLGDLAERLEGLVGPEPATDGMPSPVETAMAYVHVGQLFASAEPRVVTTILGSCVSVCLWDPQAGIGGLNHFLLPQCVENGISSARFGNVAIRHLLDEIAGLGGQIARLKAKLFGGASVIDAFQTPQNTLGMQNVALARRLLQETGIPVVAEDVGGAQGRKLVFQTRDGSAWVRKI